MNADDRFDDSLEVFVGVFWGLLISLFGGAVLYGAYVWATWQN